MKKITVLILFICSTCLLVCTTNANAATPKHKSTAKAIVHKLTVAEICSIHLNITTTCCDGAVIKSGLLDVAYWCESGEIYSFDYFYDDHACYYGCI